MVTKLSQEQLCLDFLMKVMDQDVKGSIEVSKIANLVYPMIKESIILQNHPYAITSLKAEVGYRTYVYDSSRKSNRRPIKRKTREALENALVKYYIELDKAKDISNTTLEAVYKEWLIYKRDETSTKPKTIEEYVNDWKHFLENSNLAQMKLKDISSDDLHQYLKTLTKKSSYTYKRISNLRSLLNGIFNYAVTEKKLIQSNPMNNISLRNYSYKLNESQIDDVFTVKEVNTLIKYLKNVNEPFSLAIQLFFCFFIRIGELKAIRKSDIDFVNKRIYLHRQAKSEKTLNDDLTFSKRTVKVVNQMKGETEKGFRYMYLTDEAIKIINKAIALNPTGEYLFEHNGKIINTNTFNSYLKKYCLACGVQYHSSHKIRFYNASKAYKNGTDISTLAKSMGHSKTSTTVHYLRNITDEEKEIEAFKHLGLENDN